MTGLASSLGFNQVTDWLDPRRNAMIGLGAGIASGTNLQQGIANGLQMGAQGRQADDAYATQMKAEQERQAQIADAAALKDKYSQWFMEQGQPQIAQGIADGIVEPGKAYWDFIQPKDAQQPIEINGQLVDPNTYQVIGDFRTPEASTNAPSGYQFGQDGQSLKFIPGGPADPATKGADMTQAEQRNLQLATVIEPELRTVEANWDELTNPQNQMIGANTPMGAPGFAMTSPGYQQATNSLQTIIASYLYSVSGATATDAEIKRQMDILTPKFWESKASADQKKARIRTMAEAVAGAAGKGMPAAVGGVPSGGNYVYNPATGKLEPQ